MAKKKQGVVADGLVEVRVLVDCTFGRINDVLELSPEEAEVARTNGWGDPDPAAVAAALAANETANDDEA